MTRFGSRKSPRGGRRILYALAIVVLAYGVDLARQRLGSAPPVGDGSVTSTRSRSDIAQLYAERRSGVMVETVGTIERLLSDDNEGSRHQRFILKVGETTVLVAHNIDLAPRVPAERGDSIRIRGQYEWNDRGGVLHWTHHDPDGDRPGGWIERDGERFR